MTRLVGVREASLSPMISINQDQSMFGLKERIIGMESVMFLAAELESLRGHHSAQLQGHTAVSRSVIYLILIG